uniref:Serine/threonine-protein kinase PRP4 homolog n=1 Tax=Kalanchoe fedtschenkoi TaxID=63787 RepID=A0A7N0UMZ4_KALFE
MGSDVAPIDDSRRKHRRSSDAEAEETTKRRKHKHHRHHRHHHRSRKRDEGEEERGKDVKEEAELEAGELPAVAAGVKKDDEEMEEGEIVEDEGNHLGVSGVDADDSPDSAGPLRGNLSRGNSDAMLMKNEMGVDLASLGDGFNGNDVVLVSDNSEEKYRRYSHSPYQSGSPDQQSPRKRSGSSHFIVRSGSHSRSDVEDVDISNAAHKVNGKCANDYENALSFHHDHSDRHHGSRDRARDEEREPSVNYSRYADRHDKKYAKEYSYRDLDDGDMDRGRRHERERDERREKEQIRSRTREQEKERGGGNNKDPGRQLEFDGGERVGDDRESKMATENERKYGRGRDKEIDTNLLRGRETENDRISSRTLDRDRLRDVDAVDRHRESERDHNRVKDRERYMDRGRERERSMERARDRDRGRETELSLERDRGKDRELSADRARSRGRGRELSVERAKDRKRDEKDREGKSKDWSSERDRQKDRMRDRSNDRARERRREGSYKEREYRRDRSRDRYRDSEDHLGRQHKYDGSSSKRDGQSEYKRDGNSYSRYQDKTKTDDDSRLDLSINSTGGTEDTRKREEEEQEEYQERISLQLAEEEEEDDVNRIKEESRRRRQEILEKYKNMKLQNQTETPSVEADKGNDQEKLSIQQTELSKPSPKVADDKPHSYFVVAKSPVGNGDCAVEHTSARGLGEGTPKSERSDDMFCDDIFGETPTGVRKAGKGDGLPVERSGLHDNWDDAEGYYSYRFGELLDGRYEITAAHGKGVFSSVVRAKDLKAGNGEPEEVAIKIIRNNETMFKAGQSELIILKKLVGADPDDRRHCVRFLSSFKYRNHLCLVFESLHMNLREVLKKFGRNIGLKLTAVRAYAKQLLIALKHLRNCGVLHCDIKPDNMLVNESKNVLKLCDFGNAMFAGKNEITPYLVSRFYRAPEIILGLSYDHPVDIWSIGCCLYELYTGKVLFPGATNNDMLRLHMELKGPFPKKMLRKGAFTEQHFDQDLNFLSSEDDPVTKKTIKRMIVNIKPKDIGSIISGSAGEDPKMLTNFKDFLDKIFMLDPDKRMTVSQALGHPFITGYLPGIMATHQCLDALKKAPGEGTLVCLLGT